MVKGTVVELGKCKDMNNSLNFVTKTNENPLNCHNNIPYGW